MNTYCFDQTFLFYEGPKGARQDLADGREPVTDGWKGAILDV